MRALVFIFFLILKVAVFAVGDTFLRGPLLLSPNSLSVRGRILFICGDNQRE